MRQILPAWIQVLFASLLLIATGSISISAQAPEVSLELKTMSVGSFQAFTMNVDGASEKLAKNEFRDLVKELGGRAKKSRPESYKAEGLVINAIGGSDPIDLYADFSERGSSVKVLMWMHHRGDFLGDASAERDLQAASDMMQEFGLRLRRAAIQEEIDEEIKQLGKVERKLQNLERDFEGYERDISRAKTAIERAEANIVKNEAAQEETKRELEQQKEDLEAVKEKLANVKG